MLKHVVLVCILSLSLTACAPKSQLPQIQAGAIDAEAIKQQDMAFRETLAKLERLAQVSWAIRSHNADLCGDQTVYRIGLGLAALGEMPLAERGPWLRIRGLGERPTVSSLVPGGPAQVAGVRLGDILVTAQGVNVKSAKEGHETLRALTSSKETPGQTVHLTLEREGEKLEVSVAPVRVCAYEVGLVPNTAINAFADGKQIVVYTGMMNFARTDDELAAILGHELAHNTQGHIKAKTTNAMIGGFFDILLSALTNTPNINTFQNIGTIAYSQEFESEADYVGLYYTSRAGYDIQSVAEIWRRMAVENPGAITMGNTHPGTSSRFVALEAARDEVYGKRKDGRALVPEMKR